MQTHPTTANANLDAYPFTYPSSPVAVEPSYSHNDQDFICPLSDDDWSTAMVGDLSLYDRDRPPNFASAKPPTRPPPTDFQLFEDDSPFPPPLSWTDDDGAAFERDTDRTVGSSSRAFGGSAHPNDDAFPNSANLYSPSLLPVPDLVPDSPSSPSLAYLPDPSGRGDSFYRSSSAPVPDGPRKLGALAHEYRPIPYGTGAGAGAGAGAGLSRSGGASAQPLGTSHMPTGGWAGHPTPSLQQQLVDRLSRSADAKPSFLGGDAYPLHAQLQHQQPSSPLANNYPNSSVDSPLSPLSQHFGSPVSHPDSDPSCRKTVSPQEAFLDYDDVDHALHSNPRYSAFGAIGVGAGAGQGSLFAPLPTPAAVGPSGLSRMVKGRDDERSSSPIPLVGDARGSARSKDSPSTTRHVNRFAVPRNAVSWEDSHPVEEDDDEVEEEESDSTMAPAPVTTPGGPLKAAFREAREVEADEPESEYEHEARTPDAPPVLFGARSPFAGKGPTMAKSGSGSPAIAMSVDLPRPALSVKFASVSPLPAAAPSPARSSQEPAAASRKSASLMVVDKNEDEPDSPEENSDADGDDSDEYVPEAPAPHHYAPPPPAHSPAPHSATASTSAPPPPSATSASRRTRARVSHTPSSDSDASASDSDSSSDASGPSAKRRRTSTTAPKRRRRAPAATASSSANLPSGSIICEFVSPEDGSRCGVVFRRPYDLARHKETIHGEGGREGKGRKEWICAECTGSFSRKDALIRHARIRSHDAGV